MNLTIENDTIWKPRKKNEPVYRYIVEYARSGIAKCRKCGEYIEKKSIRIGIPIRASAGIYGWISAWQHISCTRLSEADIGENISKLSGDGRVKYLQKNLAQFIFTFDKITSEEQYYVFEEISNIKIPPHLKEINPDDLIRRGTLECVEPPPTLLQHLLPFQKEGLGWMSKQEYSKYNGGILADEMGMGKTIQTVALMLKNPSVGPTLVICPVSSMNQWREEIEKNVVAGTLEVLCVTKSSNWSVEAVEKVDVVLTTYPMLELAWRKMVSSSKIRCMYCGRLYLPMQLAVHNKYFCGPHAQKTAKQEKREKLDEGEAGGKGKKSIAHVRRKSEKGQSAETIKKGLRTLHVDIGDNSDNEHEQPNERSSHNHITGPIAMYRELMEEAGRKVRGRWDKSKVNNSDEESTKSEKEEEEIDSELADEALEAETEAALSRLDKVFLCEQCGFRKLRYPFCPKNGSRHTVPTEIDIDTLLSFAETDTRQSVLHSVKWHRIILDEAHRIKSRNTSTARSVYALQSTKRWCLTGTPLQNRVGDLYSLLRFLQVLPYAKYFCRMDGCSCECFSYPFSKYSIRFCVLCGHPSLYHYNYFNKYIMNPILRHGYIGMGKLSLIMLSNDILHPLMLRRTKNERRKEMKIPLMKVRIQSIYLTQEERDIYEAFYKRSASKFGTFVKRNTVLHNYAHIFQLLSRLRQVLDHPYLVTRHFVKDIVVGVHATPFHVCAICNDEINRKRAALVEPCKHTYHPACLLQYIDGAPSSSQVTHPAQDSSEKRGKRCRKSQNNSDSAIPLVCPQCFVPMTVDVQSLLSQINDEEQVGEFDPFDDKGMTSPIELGTCEIVKNEDEAKMKIDENIMNNGILKSEVNDGDILSREFLAPPQFSDEDDDNITTLPPWMQQTAVMEGNEEQDEGAGNALNGHLVPSRPQKKQPKITSIMANINTSKFVMNSKIKAMLEYVYIIPPTDKAIVFSQFGAMLDLIEFCFNRANLTSPVPIHTVKLTGSMSMAARLSTLNAFREKESVRVILIGLKAGGEGLNLQNANHVLLADPWWNPAVEMQAIQRAHRIGQKKEVSAVRFVTHNSVEERMMELQEKKMLVFEGTVDGKTSSLTQLSEEDMAFLFTR